MKQYIAIIHNDEDGVDGIIFPNVAGCHSAGDTYHRTIQNAAEALKRYAESKNGDMTEPRSFAELISDKKVRKRAGNATFVGIPLLIEDGRCVCINIRSRIAFI